VRPNSLDEVAGPPVMEEEDSLPHSPKRSGSELIGAGAALCDAVCEIYPHVVNQQIGEKVHGLVGKGGARNRGRAAGDHVAGLERGSVAEVAANPCERRPSIHDRFHVGGGGGRSQHPHEVGKSIDIREDGGIGSSREVDCVLGRGVEQTTGSLVALLGEDLVSDTHFDVVSLSREQEKRFVLCLPSEAGDGTVVGAAVGVATQMRVRVSGNARLPLAGRLGGHVGQDCRVGDRFDEPAAKGRRRNSENDVPVSALACERVSGGRKSRLGNVATRGVAAARDNEESTERTAVVPTYFPSAMNLADAELIQVRPGANLNGFDIHLRTPRVYRVRGRVLDETGKPVASMLSPRMLRNVTEPLERLVAIQDRCRMSSARIETPCMSPFKIL